MTLKERFEKLANKAYDMGGVLDEYLLDQEEKETVELLVEEATRRVGDNRELLYLGEDDELYDTLTFSVTHNDRTLVITHTLFHGGFVLVALVRHGNSDEEYNYNL